MHTSSRGRLHDGFSVAAAVCCVATGCACPPCSSEVDGSAAAPLAASPAVPTPSLLDALCPAREVPTSLLRAASLPIAAPLARRDAPVAERGWWGRTFDTVAGDYTHFYDGGTLLALGAGVGVAAIGAHTRFDRDVRDGVQEHWRSKPAKDLSKVSEVFGKGEFLLPVYTLTAWLGPQLGAEVVGEWGERSLRAMAVAAPMLLTLQRLTGGSRPGDPGNTRGSKWEFLGSSHGVSGHATIGSITFLTMAQQTDEPWLDVLFYAASAAPGLSRLQSDRHYASQAALGWLLGFLAVEAVDDHQRARTGNKSTSWMPVISGDTVGFLVTHRF